MARRDVLAARPAGRSNGTDGEAVARRHGADTGDGLRVDPRRERPAVAVLDPVVGPGLSPRVVHLAAVDRDPHDRGEAADGDGQHQDEQRQVGGGRVTPDRAQPENGHEVAPPGRDPAEGTDRVRVEPDGDETDGDPDEDRSEGEERIEGTHITGRPGRRQAALAQEPRAGDGQADDEDLEHQSARRDAAHGRIVAFQLAARPARERPCREDEDRPSRRGRRRPHRPATTGSPGPVRARRRGPGRRVPPGP